MKKFKIIVSDLHISAGKVLGDGSINVLEDFMADRQFIEFLNFYSTGQYSDAEVELILNGDILNMIQVDYRGYFSPILTESISVEKLKRIISGHPKVFDALRKFAATPYHKITYVVGNHDIEMLWEKCKKVFREAVGESVQFKNFTYVFDGVHVEHGHMYEAVNRTDTQKIFITKGLREPILNLPWGSHFVINFVIPMKQERPAIDKVRPIPAFIRWTFLNDFFWFLKTALRIAAYFVGTRFSKSIYRTSSLITTLKIVKEITKFPSLARSAMSIMDQNPEIHTVIMGHTHTPKYRQFKDGKEYINSGTWTEVTNLDLSSLGNGTRYNYILVDYTRSPLKPMASLKEWRGYWHPDLDSYVG